MTPLLSSEIRARRRPGAIAVVWLLRLSMAFVVALPISSAVATSRVVDHPRGDALLFEPGGVLLIETLRVAATALQAAVRTSTSVLLLCLVASLCVHSALIVALAHGGRLELGEWGGRALAHLPPFVLLGGLILFVQALSLGAGVAGFSILHDLFADRMTERGADLAALLAVALGLAVAVLVGVVHDLSRAAVVRSGLGGLGGLRAGLRAFARRPVSALIGWSVPALFSVALVAAAALAAGRLAVDRDGSLRVLAVFVVHQLAVLGLIALRAGWLARALVLVSPPDETS